MAPLNTGLCRRPQHYSGERMRESKYSKAYRALGPETKDLFKLVGDLYLIEVLSDEEFTKTIKSDDGSTRVIYLAQDMSQRQVNSIGADKPTFARILQVGEGHYDTDEDGKLVDVPPGYQVGDLILVPRTAIKFFSVFGKLTTYGEAQIGLVTEGSIQGFARGEEEFERYFDLLAKEVERIDASGTK